MMVNSGVREAWGGERSTFFAAYARRARFAAGLGSPPAIVVRAVVAAVGAPRPWRRYWCGLDALLLFRPLSVAPDWLVDAINAAGLPRAV